MDENIVMLTGKVKDIQDLGNVFLFDLHYSRKGKPRVIPCAMSAGLFEAWEVEDQQACKVFGNLDEVNGGLGLHLFDYKGRKNGRGYQQSNAGGKTHQGRGTELHEQRLSPV